MKYILDNSNLAESYSGATTPLTHSFVSRVYREVYKVFARKMGVSRKVVELREEEFTGLLAFVGFRMYYNLKNWYTLLALLPAYKTNRQFFDRMLGVEAACNAKPPAADLLRRYGLDLPRVIFQALRMVVSFLFMGFLIRRFNGNFDKIFAELDSTDLGQLDRKELVDLYHNVSGMLLAKWWIPIANDFAVMVSTGLATKALSIWTSDSNSNSLLPRLTTGGNLISLDPGQRLLQIVEAIKEDEAIHELFRQPLQPADHLDALSSRHLHSRPNLLIQEYLSRYGARVPNELKLESETLSEKPELLAELLQSLLRNEERIDISENCSASTWTGPYHRNPLKHVLLKSLISWSGNSIGRREETRFRRALIFGYARRLFLALGQRLQTLGALDDQRDIFFLTEEEVLSLVNDPADSPNTRATVLDRRSNMEELKDITLPRRIETDGPINELLHDLRGSTEVEEKHGKVDTLLGTGASYGTQDLVSGTALVLPEFMPGAPFKDKILVTRYTDPGWTIVFPFVKAIVVERGGMLSHAAIVAREMGIPCIVGVENATALISDGATVQVLPKTGEVRIVPAGSAG